MLVFLNLHAHVHCTSIILVFTCTVWEHSHLEGHETKDHHTWVSGAWIVFVYQIQIKESVFTATFIFTVDTILGKQLKGETLFSWWTYLWVVPNWRSHFKWNPLGTWNNSYNGISVIIKYFGVVWMKKDLPQVWCYSHCNSCQNQ